MLNLPELKIQSVTDPFGFVCTTTYIILPANHPVIYWVNEDFIKNGINRKDIDYIVPITVQTANILDLHPKYQGAIIVAMTSYNPFINKNTWTENTFRTVAEANMEVFKEVYKKFKKDNKIEISPELRTKLEQEEDW